MNWREAKGAVKGRESFSLTAILKLPNFNDVIQFYRSSHQGQVGKPVNG